MDTNKHSYSPPLVLKETEVLLVQDILTHSVMVGFTFNTSAQDLIEMDYGSSDAYFEDYNYKWE